MLGVEQLEKGKAVCVTTQTETHSETTVQVAGGNVRVLQDGQGAPVVVLHHSTGSPGWIPFYEQLAARHAVSRARHARLRAVGAAPNGPARRATWRS